MSVNRWRQRRFFDNCVAYSVGSDCQSLRHFVTCRVLRSPQKSCASLSFGTLRTKWLPQRNWRSLSLKRAHACDTICHAPCICVSFVYMMHVVCAWCYTIEGQHTLIFTSLVLCLVLAQFPYIPRTSPVHPPNIPRTSTELISLLECIYS